MRRPLAAFTLFAALGAARPAAAAPITYSLSYLPAGEVASLGHGYENVTVRDTARAFSEPGAAGPVTLDVRDVATGATTPLELLCTDVFDTYVSPGRYTLGRLSDTVRDPVKAGQIAALLENGLSRITDNASAAALQLAVWEIENERGHTNYNVGAGQFYVTGYGGAVDPRMVADANADLENVTTGVWKPRPGDIVMQFEPVSGQHNQSFAFVIPDSPPSAAPEPSTLALLGAGVALAGWIGFAGAKRRRIGVAPQQAFAAPQKNASCRDGAGESRDG